MKNVLVMTGSPRKGGNSDLMADAFIEGVKSAGHSVVKFETAFKNIKGCRACNSCFSKGKACVFDDDFNELAPHLEKADVLVFAAPLYCFSFPAQLKAAIDKFYSFYITEHPLAVKECCLLTCGADEGEEVFEGMVKMYEHLAAYSGWVDRGKLLVAGVAEKGDVKNTDSLGKAKELGAGI
ncbi:flavodoxin family protein [Geovibrio thiophilus]|nr:flavodoxin family protein [Geovibrio thiophilus]